MHHPLAGQSVSTSQHARLWDYVSVGHRLTQSYIQRILQKSCQQQSLKHGGCATVKVATVLLKKGPRLISQYAEKRRSRTARHAVVPALLRLCNGDKCSRSLFDPGDKRSKNHSIGDMRFDKRQTFLFRQHPLEKFVTESIACFNHLWLGTPSAAHPY